jgi:hypothetical protein
MVMCCVICGVMLLVLFCCVQVTDLRSKALLLVQQGGHPGGSDGRVWRAGRGAGLRAGAAPTTVSAPCIAVLVI